MAKILEGVVVSTKMDKTVTVRVERKYRHSLYKKVVKIHKKYLADNKTINVQEGDRVHIKETRPLSKNKRFAVIKKLTN